MKLLLLVPLIFLLHTSYAWHLDQACERLGYDSMVREGMANAFDLNKAALDTMRALQQQTHSEAQMDLFEYMWSFAVKKVNGQRRVDEVHWKQINRIFERVETFSTEKGKNSLSNHDVAIYCDYSRYIEGKRCNGKRSLFAACDKDTSNDVSMGMAYLFCRSKSGYAPNMALTDNNQASNFAQIDLCAWYLKFLSTSKMKYWSDLGAKSFIAWPVHKVFNMTLLRTKMDALALLDHTLLHELTHAISLLPTDDTSGYLSYGWKRCVAMGLSEKGGLRNADSYAYFALGARMISPNDDRDPARPNRDGSTSPLPRTESVRQSSRQNQPRDIDPMVDGPTQEGNAYIFRGSNTTVRSTFTRPVHHLPLNTIRASTSSNTVQTDSMTTALLPPEARTRNPHGNTLKKTFTDVPFASSTGSAAPIRIPLTTLRHDSLEAIPSSTSSTKTPKEKFSSETLDPSPTSNNETQGPALGVKPTSLSDTRLRVTSLSSSNREDSATSYTATSSIPNITSPIFSSIQTPTINLSSPIISTQSNFTTYFPMLITVFPISNADASTSITYIATNTVDRDNQPTNVWKCQGDLCDTSSSKSCIIPAFCADEPDLGPSWGLCCGFIPLSVPGGAALLPGGPPSPPLIGPPAPPGPPGPPAGGGGGSDGGSGLGSNSDTEDDKNDDDKSDNGKDEDQDEKNTLTSTSTTGRLTSLSRTESSTATSAEPTPSDATSSSQSPTSTSKSETCSQAATASTCTMTVSIFTPTATGTSAPTPETKTIKTCSTLQPVDSCPLTISTTVTTITASTTDADASPIEHYWDWDGQHNWLEVQQSVLEGLKTALPSPSPSITTTEIASKSTASVPASITAVPPTTTSQERTTVTREPPTTAAPSVTTTDPAPIIAVITLPTTLVTLRKYLCTPSFNIWRDPQWLCYCPRTTSSSSTTLFVPLITNNLCRYTSIPDPVPSMSISYRPKRFDTD